MELITDTITFFNSPTATAIFVALFVLSEALAGIHAVKSNSVFQLVQSVLRKLAKKEKENTTETKS